MNTFAIGSLPVHFSVAKLFNFRWQYTNGIDLNTINNDNQILIEKANDYFDCVFKDVFSDFPRVTIDSVVIYSVQQNWHLEVLKQKIYNLLQYGI